MCVYTYIYTLIIVLHVSPTNKLQHTLMFLHTHYPTYVSGVTQGIAGGASGTGLLGGDQVHQRRRRAPRFRHSWCIGKH